MSTSTISLRLKDLRLSCAKENLRLFVIPTLELSCTAGILDHLQPSDIFHALRSGCIWLSRGTACHINIRISLNAAALDGQEDFIEDLGTLIREADLWNQLSLSPSLEILSRKIAPKDSDIRINISHSQPPTNLLKSATPLSVIPGDTKPPDGVSCASLNSLELILDFRSIRKSSVQSRKRKRRLEPPEEPMLLDHPDFRDDSQSSQLSDLLTEAASIFPSSSSQLRQACVTEASHEQRQDPFGSFRLDEKDDPLLLDTNTSQLLTPLSSAPESDSSVILNRFAEDVEMFDSVDTGLPVKLDFPVATKLADVGLRTLIGGRQIRATSGITLLKPDQEYTLSDFAPSLWSPGYLKAISQRSRFLPMISQSLSTSLLNNVQSSSLWRKLSDLVELQASPLHASESEISGASDWRSGSTSRKIVRVVQARLWKMTQNSLIDPLAARRLPSISTPPAGSRSRRENDDLLVNESNVVKSATFSSLLDDLADFMEEEFEDCLGEEVDSDEDLIWRKDPLQVSAENEGSQDLEELVGIYDAGDVTNEGKSGEFSDGCLDIPDKFWEDLRLEEEGDAFFIPEEFWDDLSIEDRRGAEDSSMLI